MVWAVIAGVLLWGSAAYAATDHIRVLLLDGESAGPYHNWQVTTPILKKELEETGLFEVTVATAPHADGDFSNFKLKFGDYQVVVSNLDSADWPSELRSEFEEYVRDGGGFVVVHAADNAFPNCPAYNEMSGIGGARRWSGRVRT